MTTTLKAPTERTNIKTSSVLHKTTTAVIALYLRISVDDDNYDTSDSIINQQDLLTAYVANDSVLSAGDVLIFADDGWSGTNFERPQVKTLLDMVRRGKVQTIIVKDLSRWGRNYPEVSQYIDQIFPFLGVRFISVNDRYDSNNHKGQTAPMDVAFSSLVHDIYSKELSFKIKQSHNAKAKKGEYVVGSVPYGFIRPKSRDNRLVIDEVVATVIRRIFDMASQGMQNGKIASILNSEGIDSPLEHRRNTGRSTLAIHPKAGCSYWDSPAIYRILYDERYTGTLVCFKSKKISQNATNSKEGAKRAIKLPKEEWVRVPDALPAIISTELFETVKASRRKYRRNNPSHNNNLQPCSPFTGKVVCGHCNKKLSLSQTSNPFFRCLYAKQNTGLECHSGKVRVHVLEEVLLATIKLEVQKILGLQDRQQEQKLQSQASSEKDSITLEFKKLTNAIVALEQDNMVLYERFTDGNIEREAYLAKKVANNTNLETMQNRFNELNQYLSTIESVTSAHPIVTNESALHRILTGDEVTTEIMSLLDCMIIYGDGSIEVKFTFSDMFVQSEPTSKIL